MSCGIEISSVASSASMEMQLEKQEKLSLVSWWKSSASEFLKKAKKVGEDDPRRVVHSAKVGLALTLVSFFYYIRPIYDGFGQAGMWAILTVVVVFEFTVGGTLSKGINRCCATLLAGGLGIGAEYLAGVCGKRGEPVVLGIMVFFLAAVSTFTRFIPSVKRKYDYGVLIFILTFSLVAVSGYRVTHLLELAHQRLSTILIGGATCVIISIFLCPVWAGQDLHFLIAANIQHLADFLQGFGGEEVLVAIPGAGAGHKSSEPKKVDEKQSYKSVVNSKGNEESLANFAWWEPPHGRFKFHHPWKQYLKIGGLSRECACLIQSLNAYTNSKYFTPTAVQVTSSELEMGIRGACMEMSRESGKALKELAWSIKKMKHPPSPSPSQRNAKSAAEQLKAILLRNNASPDLQEVMPVLVIASLLIDIINCVDQISLSVHQLSRMAGFKDSNSTEKALHRGGIVNPVNEDRAVRQIPPEKKNTTHQLPE